MFSKPRPLVGWCLIGIGLLHNSLGLARDWRLLSDATRGGLAGSFTQTDARLATVFWFLVTGFSLMLLGGAVAALERLTPLLPWGWIAGLAALTITGIVVMPASGFWTLLLPSGIAIARRVRRHGSPDMVRP